jgi:hypothetical protein
MTLDSLWIVQFGETQIVQLKSTLMHLHQNRRLEINCNPKWEFQMNH